MQIAVCIKSVPDPDYYDKIVIDPVKKTLVREGIPAVVNEADRHAIEAALRIKEEHGGEITVLSMGPPTAKQELLQALAMGADKAFLISDRRVGGADTLATAYTLGKLVEKTGEYDLILAGNESADGATSHVPSQLAEWLGYAHSMNVVSISVEDDNHLIVDKQFESGRGTYRLTLPAVVAVNQRINEVRLVNAINVLKAKKKPLDVLSADDLDGLEEKYIGLNGSPTKNGELETVESNKVCKFIEGSEEEIAETIYGILAPVLGL